MNAFNDATANRKVLTQMSRAQERVGGSWRPVLAVMLVVAMVLVIAPAASAQAPQAADNASDKDRENGKGFPVAGPVIWTTDAMLERARARVASEEEPFYGAWLKSKAQADAALGREYEPYQGEDFRRYFQTGRSHSQDVRYLALAFHITGEQRYADKAREILAAWAADGKDAYPGSGSPHSAGLVIGRVISIFADGYSLVWEQMSAGEREAVEDWFRAMVPPILESQRIWQEGELPCCEPPWLDQQYFNNHLGAQTLGIAAIGFALNDQKLIRYALNSPHNPRDLRTLIDGAILMPDDIGSGEPGDLWYGDPTLTEGAPAPQPGEIYDRYRMVAGTGFHYAHIHLRFLTLMAEMVHNNQQGRDYYDYVGPNGENFELSYEFYAEFLITGDPAARTGYYADGKVDFNMLPLYELALRQYSDSDEIREVLESRDRVAHDIETFGWTAVLTHGLDGLAAAPPYPGLGVTEWEFNTDGDLEGWTIRKADASVADGSLHIEVTGADPGIVSPDELGADADTHRYLKIRLRNTTSDTSAQVFFVTDDDSAYGGAKKLGFTIEANDDGYREYVIDMGANDAWTGRVKQVRIDPVQGSSTGTVSIDYVRLAETT
jgi:hypothetical protein